MKKLSLLVLLFAFIACKNDKQTETTSEKETTTETTTSETKTTKYPTNVYFGDTHLHTDLSMDAGAFGNRIGMDEAYKFARGEEVTSSTGLKTKLNVPLDFLVIADHSDGLGLFPAVFNKDEWVMKTPEGKRWSKMLDEGKNSEFALDLIFNFSQGNFSFKTNDPTIMKPVWETIVAAAEKYNEPGKFTAFIGYEWTSLIAGNNLHRNVIYRDNGDKAITQLPYTNEDSSDPEKLWENLASYEERTGGQVLAIPHNGNLSNGMMFMEETISGSAFDEAYLKKRAKWEPLYEVTQIKGDGEAHPFLSPNDEFSDYENWDYGNLDLSTLKTNEMLEHEYARSALKIGLKYKTTMGTNPYKFGLIGSTDSHTSLATADDNNFFGKASNVEPSKERWDHPFVKSEKATIFTWQTLASGYAAVWAEENTRTSIWDAMKRKETYGTTGSRMQVRFFGGWDYSEADLANLVDAGYSKGVPMGGDMPAHPKLSGGGNTAGSKKPSFMVYTLMDPNGGSLDRIQIVKGWANADGTLNEKVVDVIWSGDRKMDADGKVPSVGNSVNLEDASWDNSIGATELKAVWTDEDFDPALEAFYYVRVLEIPTPRWTLYDKLNYGAELSEKVPLTQTERGYTSPIWYSPK